jgi:hypothetical protein
MFQMSQLTRARPARRRTLSAAVTAGVCRRALRFVRVVPRKVSAAYPSMRTARRGASRIAQHVPEPLAADGIWMIVEPAAGDRVRTTSSQSAALTTLFRRCCASRHRCRRRSGWLGAQAGKAGIRGPGVFAVGDARYRSMKPVAAAVGDGATAVRLLHEYLAASDGDEPSPAHGTAQDDNHRGTDRCPAWRQTTPRSRQDRSRSGCCRKP